VGKVARRDADRKALFKALKEKEIHKNITLPKRAEL
jgi:hypothetical protein